MIHTPPDHAIAALEVGYTLYAFQLPSEVVSEGLPTVSALQEVGAIRVERSTRRAFRASIGTLSFLWGEGLSFPKESRLLADVLTREDMRFVAPQWSAHYDGGTFDCGLDDEDLGRRIGLRQRLGDVIGALPDLPRGLGYLGWWAERPEQA